MQSICPVCGHEHNDPKQCPICGYWYQVVRYKEHGQWVNYEEYEKVLQNVKDNKRYNLTCPECFKQAKMYYDGYGLTCSCGGLFSLRGIDNPVKFFREKNNLTQEEAAKMLGISRSLLAMIEAGQRKIPDNILGFVTG
ncbi:helix-turn-helix domain-containing protein [Sporolituus thermophilus]|uniref:Helix-turn-helix domain-containing protein n=1 Tax=Sporolituus thermophilus DSM 23256 TaxID=1123285 RepID=A0A1G7KXL4_9FIRM|nr:helix-turn-helix transcriptional regulator [Sporolituus thermophilus]SDF42002.1 Helix-turn-helix domain-containing protein [Sporolituus thermophilus DSM 23256]